LALSTNRVIVLASATTIYLNAQYYISGAGQLLSFISVSGPPVIPNTTELAAVRIA
jgi:hypothetical protein